MWVLLLLILGLATSLDTEAQISSSTSSGDFFEILSANELSNADKILAGLPADLSGDSPKYLRFNAAESNTENGFYTVNLKDETSSSNSWMRVTYASEVDGRLALRGMGEHGDFAIYLKAGEGASGYGYTETHRFSFTPLFEGLSEIQYDIKPTGDFNVHPTDAVAPNIIGAETEQSTIECAATIDVLFLRTQGADDDIAALGRFPFDFEEMVTGSVDHTNETLQNSGVGPKQIRAIIHPNVVHQIQYSDPGNGPGISPCLAAMDILKLDNTIQTLRQFYNADVVVYYDDQLATCSGVAGGFGVQYDDAYVLNNVNAETQYYSYFQLNTHELGHIFGGYHSRVHELTQGPWPHFTMMKVGVDKGRKIPHYSNPAVDYTHPDNGNTEPTGTSQDNNSQFVIRNFCRQAEMETTGDFLAQIQALQGFPKQPCDEIRFRGRVDAGNTGGPNSGPYTFQWRVSTIPAYGSSSVFSTAQNPIWTLPNVNRTYYVWLDVTTAGGVTTRVMRSVGSRCAVETPQLPDLFRTSPANGNEESLQSHEISVLYGNITSLRTITFNSDEASENTLGVVKLYNSTGQLVSVSQPTPIGLTSHLLASGKLPIGIYHLVLESEDGSILQTDRIPLVK